MNQDPKIALVINAIPYMQKFEKVTKYFPASTAFSKIMGNNHPKLRTSEQIFSNASIMATGVIGSRIKKPSKMLFRAMNSLP